MVDVKASLNYIDENRKIKNLDVPVEYIEFWSINHPDNLSIIHQDQWMIFLYVLDKNLLQAGLNPALMQDPALREHFRAWQMALALTYLTKNKMVNVLPFELFDIEALGTMQFHMKKFA